MNINKQLNNTVYTKHNTYDWQWHQLQVVRGCYFKWADRNGVEHRIDGHDKADLLARVAAL